MKYIQILLLLLLFQQCTETIADKDKYFLDSAKDERLANIYVNIFIGDNNSDPEKFKVIHLEVFDHGKKNNKNTILINNQAFNLATVKSNYYTTYSYYQLSENKKERDYLIEIILADSSRHQLAYIKPRQDYTDIDYAVPKKFTAAENLSLTWEGIYVPTVLNIKKEIYDKKYAHALHRNAYQKDYIYNHELTTKNGSYIVDKSAFEDSLTVTVGLSISFRVRENGAINPSLQSGSQFIYENEVLYQSILDE
ncbi:hypothetical protein DNU06_15460 [Putridiphycobacter roseus]|uniref:DUF4249 domain-containing protein n=1 Tax=Putridiphycobacter roseus TaxID=2219161 RepID=A0A2W1MWX4_9FLAO|nr:hypothetical protein [Putridiphycobacter roseus]PZE15904.1 hypothetical protein DNU06_15460 [Putridiphycobacter roseus]